MQYKLIKWYPSLPDNWVVGDVVEKSLYNYVYAMRDKSSNLLYTKEVENHPEFWEKVEEKDYEILSFIRIGSMDYGGAIFSLQNGLYSAGTMDNKLSLIYCLKEGFNIHSVKRLSDGEVFSINDNAQTKSKNPHTIMSFYIKQKHLSRGEADGIDRIWVNWEEDYGGNWLENIEKIKEPMFKTEDGVDIYEGDAYYSVVISDFVIRGPFTLGFDTSGYYTNPATCKVFSTEKAAKGYIIYNKPCLSVMDIVLLITTLRISEIDKLWEFVKERI